MKKFLNDLKTICDLDHLDGLDVNTSEEEILEIFKKIVISRKIEEPDQLNLFLNLISWNSSKLNKPQDTFVLEIFNANDDSGIPMWNNESIELWKFAFPNIDFDFIKDKSMETKNQIKNFKQNLIIIVGPTGSGKNFILNILENHNFKNIVSITDRSQRAGEVNGRDYLFLGKREDISNIRLIEKIELAGTIYGIPAFEFDYHYYHENDSVLIVEPDGLYQILTTLRKNKEYRNINIKILFLNIPREVRFNNILKDYSEKYPENAMEKTLTRIVRGGDDIAERFQRFYKNNCDDNYNEFRYLEEKQIIVEFIEFEKFDEQDILDIIEKIKKEDTEENESLLVRSEDEMEAEDSFRYSYKNNDVIVDKLTGKEFPRN